MSLWKSASPPWQTRFPPRLTLTFSWRKCVGTGKPVCPHCGSIDKHYFLEPRNGVSRETSTGKQTQRRLWKCSQCRKQFSALTGTVMHGSHIRIRTWLFVAFEFASSKNGVSVSRDRTEVQNCTPIRHGPFATACVRRCALVRTVRCFREPSFRRGLHRRQAVEQAPAGAHGEAAPRSQGEPDLRLSPSFPSCTVKAGRSGRRFSVRRTQPPPRWNRAECRRRDGNIRSLERQGALVHAAWSPIRVARIRRPPGREYVKPNGVTTNAIEGYFSQLKRSIDGTHHHVSATYLNRYLAEFDYRYTTCDMTDGDRMVRLLRQSAGRRLAA